MPVQKTVIFDFDGTIADSLGLVVEIIQQLVPGHENASKQEIESLRGLSAVQLARYLNVPLWKAPGLVKNGQKIMQKRLGEVPVFEGIKELLLSFNEKGCHVHLVSFNSSENIEKFLINNGIQDYFQSVTGGVGIFGKKRAIKKVCEKNKLNRDKVWYIGDEVRDVKAAKKAGVHMIAVGWGFNNLESLEALHPDAVAIKPKDLEKVILWNK